MLIEAIQAEIPMISVRSDDSLYQKDILKHLLKDYTVMFGMTIPAFIKEDHIKVLVVENLKSQASSINMKQAYDICVSKAKIIIFVNPSVKSNLFFDGGLLPVPKELIFDTLIEAGFESLKASKLINSLTGLTLKSITEICRFAMVRYGELTATGIQHVKQELAPDVSGLTAVQTDMDFYWPNPKIEEYLDLNSWFFTDNTNWRLVPRGILLEGQPGIGKSQAAKYIAGRWKVPLFMLNMATVMNKYLGASENNMMYALQHIDREAPMVLLIDEVEKLFKSEGSNDPSERLLSQLLWWLQEHKTKVFTVMTTNNIKKLPKELYRSGRIDEVFTLKGLSKVEALKFANNYLKSFNGQGQYKQLDMVKCVKILFSSNDEKIPHANIVGAVTKELKRFILSEQFLKGGEE